MSLEAWSALRHVFCGAAWATAVASARANINRCIASLILPRSYEFLAHGRLPVVALDVAVEYLLEVGDDGIAVQRLQQLAVHIHRRLGIFECAWEADAEVGMLGFAWAVDDAAHDGEFQFFHAGILLAPLGHRAAEITLYLLGQLLEVSRSGAAAPWAACNLRHDAADGERLQNLLSGLNFFGTVAVGFGGERDANGVSDAGQQKRGEAGGGGDEARSEER